LCRDVGLFCKNTRVSSGETGLFGGDVRLFCRNVGLFCGNIGLFCGETGLFCGKIGRLGDIRVALALSQMCVLHSQKENMYTHTIFPQKSPVYPQKSPVFPQKSPKFLRNSLTSYAIFKNKICIHIQKRDILVYMCLSLETLSL